MPWGRREYPEHCFKDSIKTYPSFKVQEGWVCTSISVGNIFLFPSSILVLIEYKSPAEEAGRIENRIHKIPGQPQ
jgi:hypothetical protein